jgi:protein TonB
MLANALIWLFSILLAIIVHVVGLLLFEPRQPSLPSPNAFSEEIVVMLGEGSGRNTDSIRPLKQPDSVMRPPAPTEARIDPLAGIEPEAEIENKQVEEVVSAPLESGYAEPEEALNTNPPNAVIPGQESALPRIEVAETGDAVPDLSTSDPEAADTVVATVVPTEEAERKRPMSVAETGNHTEVVASRPAIAEITRPGSELTAVVAPTQHVDDASTAGQPDDVAIEESPVAVVDVVSGVTADSTPAPVPVAASTGVLVEPIRQAEESEFRPPVSPEVEEEITESSPAAVVLEFETVEAAPVTQTRDPDPNAATLVSIEEQIARALTLDESQSSGLGMGVVARYAGYLKGRLEESMHYPRAARLAGQQGSVVVRFVIDRNGTVLSIVLEKPSGHAILDREAVEMIERAEPFPTMPGEMSGEVLELRVPIAYKIDDISRTLDIPPIELE